MRSNLQHPTQEQSVNFNTRLVPGHAKVLWMGRHLSAKHLTLKESTEIEHTPVGDVMSLYQGFCLLHSSLELCKLLLLLLCRSKDSTHVRGTHPHIDSIKNPFLIMGGQTLESFGTAQQCHILEWIKLLAIDMDKQRNCSVWCRNTWDPARIHH